MIKQLELISANEITFDSDSLYYDYDEEGRKSASFYLPVWFDAEEKFDISLGEEPPNVYIVVTQIAQKKLHMTLEIVLRDAPGHSEYEFNKVKMLPGQVEIFREAIDKFLKDEPDTDSYENIFQNVIF